MTEERFQVTGALGCIGAWVVRNLVQEGIPTAVFDLGSDPRRLKLIMTKDELAQVRFIVGDITDLPTVERAFAGHGATHIIHLAALQVPFCKADPSLGARVNVVGTVNVFEAVKKAGLRHVAYASSIAVYGPPDEYPRIPLPNDAEHRPRTLYGVYKTCNEGTARVYWLDNGISSIGLRPYVVYGPGRDQGLTSTPTRAMLAAAVGRPYHISFGGRCDFQFADDVARAFIQAARTPFEGAAAFNLRGSVVHMREVVAAIEAAVPASAGQIIFEDTPLPFPREMDDAPLTAALGPVPYTSLDAAVATTIETFKQAIADGRLDPEAQLA
jgi:nucleoside-diphosphate-sugar epimerase